MIGQPTPVRTRRWFDLLLLALVLAWVIGVTLVVQLFAWFASAFPYQSFQRADVTAPQVYFGAALVQALGLLLPLAPLSVLWRAVRYRAAFRTGLAAACFLLLLAPARLVPSTYPQIELLVSSILALVFVTGVWALTGRGPLLVRGASRAATALALALGLVFALPWLRWGALGSPFDLVLGSFAALVFGVAASLLLTRIWLRGLRQASSGTGRDIFLGGLVSGVVLLVMGSAYSFNGSQVLLMLSLAACGWLCMSLAYMGASPDPLGNARALAVFLVLLAGAPLLLFDPDAGILEAAFSPGEMLTFAFRAVGLVILAGWLAGLLLFLLRNRLAAWRDARAVWLGAGVLLLLCGLVYFFAGQPGFFGDRVFVILKDQADVSSAAQIADYNARRTMVYQTLTTHAAQTQQGLRADLDRLGIHYTPYYLVNALEVNAEFPIAWGLAARPDVDRVLPSPILRPLPEKPSSERGSRTKAPSTPDWNLTLIGADRVWNELGVRGRGILVGQSDSGVDGSHPELSAQYRGRDGADDYNWLDPWNHSASPTDIGGHGTHTLGTILGKQVGVAPDAEWIGCVNLARNLGNPPFYLNCMQFMLAPYPQRGDPLRDGDPKRGALVLNNSWGCPDVEGCDPNALLAAVHALRAAGVFVVASAGNDGPACSTIRDPIALYPDAFSVGAINRTKQLADFSSRGPVIADASGRIKPDISAPGVAVLSALPGGTYGIESGTSMAGPHIVGVVALMWSANPKLIGQIEQTEQILRETAQRANLLQEKITCGDPNAIPNDLEGYGIVDAYAAVKRALADK
jgi:subtilisin family serine protease